MLKDQWGHEITAASARAVTALERTLMAYLGLRLETGDRLKETFKADPEMPMAHIARGNFMQLFCHASLQPKTDDSIAGAEAAISKHGATRREATHLAALKAWRAGDLVRTLDLWEEILLEHPRDVLALRLAHFLHFYLGESQHMRDSVLRVMHGWDDSVPAFGFVEGMRAFGFEETAAYAAAEAAGRRAVELNPEDCWGTHAVAHVMEMMGRHEDGIEWLEGLCGNWGAVNNFRFHAWWHLALYYLEREDVAKVLELYDGEFRKEPTDDHIDIANAVSMLARLEMRGVDIGDRWVELGAVCAKHIDDHIFAFHDAHYIMAVVAAGREADTRRMLETMAQAANAGTTEGPVFREVGLPLAQAIVAYRKGEYGTATDLMLPIRYRVHRIGGSHAQRDLFAQLLIRAAMEDGRHALARALTSERLQRRPGSPRNWTWHAEALAGAGDPDGAATARAKADALLAA